MYVDSRYFVRVLHSRYILTGATRRACGELIKHGLVLSGLTRAPTHTHWVQMQAPDQTVKRTRLLHCAVDLDRGAPLISDASNFAGVFITIRGLQAHF